MPAAMVPLSKTFSARLAAATPRPPNPVTQCHPQ
jgi:hypothetical protein